MGQITEYYSGQGRVSYAKRSALGKPIFGYVFLGDCSKLETKTTVESKGHNEHQTGKGAEDASFETAQKVEITATFDEIREDNLNLYLYGDTQKVAAKTVTDEPLIAYTGKETALANLPKEFTSLTNQAKDATYIKGTDYEVSSTGMIAIPTDGAITDKQELLANYETEAERITTAFTALNSNIYLRFDGLNRGSDNVPVIIEVYKARFEPADMMAMINDDFATYDVKGKALYDNLNADNSLTGGFFRVRTIDR